MAIAPEARMLPKITNSTSTGPRIAPTAPNNFQSPAPSPRNKTSGSSRPKASNAPSSANSVPCHPESTLCTVNPATTPGTVSQLGIRRERKSSKAAVIVNTRLIVQIIPAACMGSFFLRLLCGSASGAGLKTCHHGRAVAKAVLRIARLGIQVGCGGREDSIDRRCQSSQSPNRREGEQNEKECILRQVLAFLVLPQLLNHIFHSRSSKYRILALGCPRFVSVRRLPAIANWRPLPTGPLTGTQSKIRILRGLQIAGGRGEDAVDCRGESAEGTDRRERKQNQQQSVLRQVLAFFFLPQTHRSILHGVSFRLI